MKKAYEKPKIYYESFTLSSSISSGCVAYANLAENQCSVTVPELGYTIFGDTVTCNATPPGGNDMVCYHAPTEWNNVYDS